MPTTIDFLRHGEVAGGSYYRGSTDDLLTKPGWQQMSNAVANQSWDHIISSPLHRCLDFAQNMNTKTTIPFSIEPDWQEISFGDWEGKTAEQINPEDLFQFYQDPVNNPPLNAENFSEFLFRVGQAWENLIENHPDQHVLVITHAGVIRSLFTLLLNLPIANIFNLQIDHASITRFQCFHNNPDNYVKLVFHNFCKQDYSAN